LRSELTATQNIARQLSVSNYSQQGSMTYYKERQIEVLYTTETYVYPESGANFPSLYVPVAFEMIVTITSIGLIWTYSTISTNLWFVGRTNGVHLVSN
jgi:hypothetical protein